MSRDDSLQIGSAADFFAQLIALKHDGQERLQMLSECLMEHHNPQAAHVFDSMLGQVNENIAELESMAAGMDLPEIAPWEYQWNDLADCDCNCFEKAHYQMSGSESMQLALSNEQRNLKFLQLVNQQISHPDVKQLSQQLLEIEQKFLFRVRRELESEIEDEVVVEDLDPPNMPE